MGENMSAQVALVAEGQIEQIILFIRDQKVMIDADLARVYGVEARRVREQLKRNLARFPDDFMFRLTKEELIEVSANCGHLSHLKFSPVEHYLNNFFHELPINRVFLLVLPLLNLS